MNPFRKHLEHRNKPEPITVTRQEKIEQITEWAENHPNITICGWASFDTYDDMIDTLHQKDT